MDQVAGQALTTYKRLSGAHESKPETVTTNAETPKVATGAGAQGYV